ncbi:hypothetical protein SAMN05216228_1010168 [Rhizobium tibeticum]|uniref:DUF6894 domain-containing protein n=1 Tax=Rhizobium tibeticum TaxID=501024 RepID=A0A1H8L8W6_9HYPH|nr:hypothetical protein [Rhizobium tibeticum]SEH87204.1 hypothetical protein RTCCBAU85039_2810 [Rhizobium tibeticum]SEO01624.1 hypothetical protein SAMN05216228_1010168 [Rhizobium tibeticum]
MPRYYFQIIDSRTAEPLEVSCEFVDVDTAKAEARQALAESAADGLPEAPLNMMSVELFDENRRPITEIRLILEEIRKN